MSLPEPASNLSLDLTGRSLGDYTLIRRLGHGGMADVYLARQASLGRNVALKILKPELAHDNSYVKRFHREAQSAATLVQANIVQIFEVGACDGLHFIAQEYVHGRNLRQYLDRHGAVEPVMAINVLRQCSLALQKATAFSVVHRDIKPENIMISTTGEIKVTDFGLARINDDASRQALTQIGITMGTPLYMSPEQVEGRQLDSRSDIYSLGVTVYHTLAGQPPFEGENALAIAVQQVKDHAQPLTELRPDVPVELCQIVHRMMAKDPADRPQDPSSLLKELRKVKIDLDEDWDLLIEKLSTNETIHSPLAATLSHSKLAATQQLQQVMKGQIRSWWKSRSTLVSLVLASLASLLIGTLAGMQAVPEFPLNIEQSGHSPNGPNRIPKKKTIAEQYESAYWGTYALSSVNDPRRADYWVAVLDNFPIENASGEYLYKMYYRRAQERLGEVYLSQEKLDEALEIYDTFENNVELSEYFNVVGSAGKAIAYDLMSSENFPGKEIEQEQKVRECLSRIGSRTDLLNKFMREMIAEIRNRLASPSPLGRYWQPAPWA
jgi:serine/threonine-protein kinase